MAVAALDIFNVNPWSRINTSEFGGVGGIREWVRKYLRGLRGGPRISMCSTMRPGRGATNVSASSTASSQSAAGRTSCWPISVTSANRTNSTTNTVYSRPTRPSLQTGASNNNGSTGLAAPRRPYPSNLRNSTSNNGSNNGGSSVCNGAAAVKAPTTIRSVGGKSERVGAIQRQR